MNPVRVAPRDFRPIIREAVRHGWHVSTSGGGHLRLRGPSGALVFAARTPSDWRARRGLIKDLKRAGADWL